MDRKHLKQSVSNQTDVSTTLATHLLSKKHDKNVVFSPLSIHVALSVLAAGSKGQTLDQLLAFLKTNTTDNLNSLYSQLVPSIFPEARPRGGPGPRVSFANGFWVDKTLSLKPTFKQVVDTVYKSECNQVDFHNKAAEVADELNSWAEEKTNGLIKQVITADEISNVTWLVFANAIYFKGLWRDKFKPKNTKEYDFHLLNGNKVQVPFMTNFALKSVGVYDDFKVLRLPYLQGRNQQEFSMYFFLPNAKDGLQSLVQKIGSMPDFIDRHIPHNDRVIVPRFLIPVFKISFGLEVSDMLKELGLVLPFNGGDGLSEMVDSSDGQGIYVSRIIQKSFVEVNEEGTEAIAYIEEQAHGRARNPPEYDKVDFVADHPFLFVIKEDVTGVVLFMGQVVDPRVD
ncbi:putative Serpin family protein [Helianthus annuus]|uniref:Putative serpin n=2 Tax=Helianthus annuus TaxID=4232 RepID=A0A251USC2_HELAN|nr:putative Serpin family protein [Helianthus annuus]KAJ0570772.1 putative Serpin family protein [Helianthus annuus]KAJ0577716.1 putative Serpin family protein [Helianthus annuus]KAJ0585113.1 putative Serpin family protein [Helianthus annuus]KAJ0919582.1 putative Serpin family protein [Helianthus annuus]